MDATVLPEDERTANRNGKCFYCSSSIGASHRDDCVVMEIRRFDAIEPFVWYPIETLPFGNTVLLWFDEGEKGGGGMEVAMVFQHEHEPTGMSFWTHGGPNAGSDWSPRDDEKPSKWMKITYPKDS